MNFKRNFLSMIILILSSLMIILFTGQAAAALPPGTKLPSFTLKSIDNSEVTLDDFKGKVVIVHLWKCQ